ncbi:hypothetical protein BP6252_08225 [Coleophoma cylindrospora]|uniref:3-beta hydroxysteroid dehydrogenase/isomerase domain-containing protein n=1 Tax=Coleophoma cylindrospora TaxID=1849047 RepID=A0A3D8R585_9HELO|nr:hypothetical protein BP6252_08225 [Coleophoma cylindrospora]
MLCVLGLLGVTSKGGNTNRFKGTVRDEAKRKYIERSFHTRHSASLSSAFIVPDVNLEGACDTVILGCSGIVHTASEMCMQPDITKAVIAVVHGVTSLLDSAVRTPSVKRFLYTSNCNAAAAPKANVRIQITPELWNEDSLKDVMAEAP